MVQIAQWVAKNTEPEALLAAHDIGALGYFSERGLIDLAGLVSPDVIPFIRDEEMLAEYMNNRGADYLITFPGWYPVLVSRSEVVFESDGVFSSIQGGENLVLYRWRARP
jgi:hypothetical protein